MPNQVNEPIEITTAQGVTDAIKATVRYVGVIITFVMGLGGLIGQKNAEGAVTYLNENLGGAVSAAFALGGMCIAAYGIYRTWKRGQQLVQVEPHAPNSVLRLKK
jgi:hypothetical protein